MNPGQLPLADAATTLGPALILALVLISVMAIGIALIWFFGKPIMERMSAEANEEHQAMRQHGVLYSKLCKFKPSDANPVVQFWLRAGVLLVVIFMIGGFVRSQAMGAGIGEAFLAAIVSGGLGAVLLAPIVLAVVIVATRDSSPLLIDLGAPNWMSKKQGTAAVPIGLRISVSLLLLVMCLVLGAQHDQYICALSLFPFFAVPFFMPTSIQLRERGIAYPLKMTRVWEEIDSWRWLDENILVVITTHPKSFIAPTSFQTMIAFPIPKEARAKTEKIMLERVGPAAEDEAK